MPSTRLRPDACPGALTLHEAADGYLARVRLPGGLVSAPQLRVLAAAARELGDGRLELTSRGNVQLRGLAAGCDLADRLAEAGLLPSATHERVRNIVASPFGPAGPVRELDAALCAEPRLSELPGRFLFAVDDGSGDTADLGADARVVAGFGHQSPYVDLGGQKFAVSGVLDLLTVAHAFLDVRGSAWRVAELPPGALADQLGWAPIEVSELPARPEPAGWVGGALVALAPLGRLSAAQAEVLASAADDLRITPWRSVVLRDPAAGAFEALAAAGFGLDAGSPWHGISACTGRPGCAKALADVQADARTAALAGQTRGRRVHWSGCARRCGRPAGVLDRVATGAGYVDDWVSG